MSYKMTGMQHCEHEDQASLYALGLLDEVEIGPFEQHLNTCAVCGTEVRESSSLTVQLAELIPQSHPPAALRKRVLAEAVLPRGVVALVHKAQMQWQATPFPGVTFAPLYEDSARGEMTVLFRMQPGSRFPSHHHASLEHGYVLEGDLVFEDHTLTAGDYFAGAPNRDHTVSTTRTGCLVFIVHNVQNELHPLRAQ